MKTVLTNNQHIQCIHKIYSLQMKTKSHITLKLVALESSRHGVHLKFYIQTYMLTSQIITG